MAATTLEKFTKDRWQQLVQKKDQIQKDLTAAQKDLADARQAQATLTQQYADLEKAIAAKRQAIAKAPTAADAEVLLPQLRQLEVDRHNKSAKLLAAEETLAGAEAERARVGHRLTDVTSRLASAESAKQKAAEEAARRGKWQAALAAAPLDTLATDAAAALTATACTGAKSRLEGDFPSELLGLAKERYELAAGRLERLEAARDKARDLLDKQQGNSTELTTAFQRREAELRDHVMQGEELYDLALERLAAVVASPALTKAVKDWIDDTVLESDRKAAATKEQARIEALIELEKAQAALDLKVLELRAKDIDDDASIAADTDVTSLTSTRDTAKTDYDTAAAAVTSAMHATLDLWEAAVPESAWGNLADFLLAKSILDKLKDVIGPTLGSGVTADEAALVAQLLIDDKDLRTREMLSGELAVESDGFDYADNARKRQLLSALRGDG